MARPVALAMLLTLAACSSVPANQPTRLARSDDPLEVGVGGRMVDDTNTVVSIAPVTKTARVDGLRAEIVYMGLLGTDPAGKRTIRLRYEEHKIANGIEVERPEYRAEVTLDLAQSRTLDFKGWRIGVLEATDTAIRYQVVGSPAPR
jgi:RNase P/RNase MRP subunit p29